MRQRKNLISNKQNESTNKNIYITVKDSNYEQLPKIFQVLVSDGGNNEYYKGL